MRLKPKYSLDDVSQEVDLESILGRVPTDVEAKQFIDDALDLIIERTQSGVDINGKQFKAYSSDYARFKGVSRGSVDLTLTSEMLASMAGEFDRGMVKIFVDEEQVLKSYNHNTGDTLPKRTYFGLTDTETEDLASTLGIGPASDSARELNLTEILNNIGFVVDED
jgi:hypothetical protein